MAALIIIFYWKDTIYYNKSINYSDETEVMEIGDSSFMIAVRFNQEKNFITRPVLNITLETRHYIRDANGV